MAPDAHAGTTGHDFGSGVTTSDIPPGYEAIPVSRVRLRARRRAIARNLEASNQIPSLTADVQMELGALLEARAEHNSDPSNPKASALAFIARAAVATIGEFPNLNASYTESALLHWNAVNLGIAVDARDGLVVPVVRNAEGLAVTSLARAIAAAALKARDGSLALEDLVGGTFTVSNPGSVGPVLRAEALINPPQVALLGLPAAKKMPVVVTDEDGVDTLVIRTVICPSLTFDHRAIDGGEVVRFLDAMRYRVESWRLTDYVAEPSATAHGNGATDG